MFIFKNSFAHRALLPVSCPRNGTNARAFGSWSGLSASDGMKQVLVHLAAANESLQSPKLTRFIREVDEPVVVIASCKAIQALQSLDCVMCLAQGSLFLCLLLIRDRVFFCALTSQKTKELLLSQIEELLRSIYLSFGYSSLSSTTTFLAGNWIGDEFPELVAEIQDQAKDTRPGSKYFGVGLDQVLCARFS